MHTISAAHTETSVFADLWSPPKSPGVLCDSKYGTHYLWYSPLYTETVEHKVVGNSFHLQLKTAKMLFSPPAKETEHSRPYYDTININSIPIWWSMQTSSCFALENSHLKSIGTTESPQDCHHRKIFSGSDELKPGSWRCYAKDPTESDICLNTSRFEVFTSSKVLLIVFKCLNGVAPAYHSGLLLPYEPSRTLRYSSTGLLVIPLANTKTHGEPDFHHYASRLWNSRRERWNFSNLAFNGPWLMIDKWNLT